VYFVIVLLLSLVTGQTRLGYILEIPKKKSAREISSGVITGGFLTKVSRSIQIAIKVQRKCVSHLPPK